MANAFSQYFKNNLVDLTNSINNSNTKTIVIGGGIHFARELSDPNLQKVVQDFAHAVLDTGGTIGVRGSITYDFFANTLKIDKGIYNIGCPSMRYYGYDFKPIVPKRASIDRDSKVAVCFTPFSDHNETCAFYDRIWRSFPKSFAIMQDRCEALLLQKGEPTLNDRVRELLPCYSQHFMIRQGRCRITPNTREWIKILSSFDFCIGSRIHGVVVSILAGTPALLIAVDERQVEIAQYFKIPYLRQDIITRETPLDSLYQYAVENSAEIYNNYFEKLEVYTDFLKINGIPVSKKFKKRNQETNVAPK